MNDVFFCNAGLRTVLHFTGQSTMPETKFCSRGELLEYCYQCLVAVGYTYHLTTSAHSYNTMASIFLLGRIFCAYVANIWGYQNYHIVSSFSNKKILQAKAAATHQRWGEPCEWIYGETVGKAEALVGWWSCLGSENKTSWDSLLGLAHLCSIKKLMYPPQEWDGWHCPKLIHRIPASQKNHTDLM